MCWHFEPESRGVPNWGFAPVRSGNPHFRAFGVSGSFLRSTEPVAERASGTPSRPKAGLTPAASSGSPHFPLPHSLGGMWRCMNAQTRGHCRAWMHTTGIAAGADLPWASPSSVMGASDSNSALASTPCGMCMRYWGTPSRGHPHGYSPDPMIGIRTDTHQGLPTSAAAHPGAIPAIAGTESNFLVAWPGGGRRGRKDASKRPDKPVDFLKHLSE